MPPESRYPVEDIKEYDVRTAAIVVGNYRIEDLESFGWSSSKDHDPQATIDNNRVWVKAVPEITGSLVMKATSPSINAVREIYEQDQVISLTGELSDDDARDNLTFIGCMLTDIDMSDHEINGMPTLDISWEGVESR